MTKLKLTNLPKINFFGLKKALFKQPTCIIRKETVYEPSPFAARYDISKGEYAVIKGIYIWGLGEKDTIDLPVEIQVNIREGGMDYPDRWDLRVRVQHPDSNVQVYDTLCLTKEQGKAEEYMDIMNTIYNLVKKIIGQNSNKNRKHD